MNREMRHSGIEWIGEIPKEWNCASFKYFHEKANVGESIDKTYCSDNPVDTLFYTAGIEPIHTIYKDFPQWKYTEINDLLLARNGTPYVYLPVPNSVYSDHIIRAEIKKNCVKEFIRYCLQQAISYVVVDTVSIPTWSISLWDKQYLPLPSYLEQQKIANYLDKVCGEVDEMIALQEQMIEELKAYKQSVITEAVTKGLNSNAPMKDSGIDWIGEVPEHWNLIHFYKTNWIRARLGWKGLKADEYTETGYPFLSAFNIINDKLVWEDLNFINQERYDESPEIKLSIGDLLLVKDGAGIGKCAVVDELPFGEATVNSSLAVVSPNREIVDPHFQYYYFKSAIFQNTIWLLKIGMGVPHLTQENMRDIIIPNPPLSEQQSIASYLDTKCAEIDALIAIKQAKIEELKEYKKSVIYEYVTGKKEVE